MSFLKKIIRKITPNPFFQLLKTSKLENKTRFLILWNRGLGDIPLGLYALVQKIKQEIPKAEVTFLTRKDLYDGFKMLDGIQVYAHPKLKRADKTPIEKLMEDLGLFPSDYDHIIEKIDTDRWLSWQIGKVIPKLSWDSGFDNLSEKFGLQGKGFIGAHVSSETDQYYGYDKNWPKSRFKELFSKVIKLKSHKIVLFGLEPDDDFQEEGIVDLRGKTSVFEMLSLMKNHCSHFIAPDSGVLSFSYYVNEAFPIKMISIWSDPKQGVLRQKVASPNPLYKHIPLIGEKGDTKNISIDSVLSALDLKAAKVDL